ncbi:MAG TPA: hypothetical protein PK784_12770 [Tenuifilaceae bacterium]|nr:hypothetical protein [Tenuifilaceae bacterium]HPN22188.1 hypothetical protein [Tenuifilaceae bacterium]
MSIINYLEPDSRWSLWHCKTHEEFIEKFLVKGKFHENVPESVVKAYEVVERIIAYSFFYYPLFDEAIAKTTRIFETAVKIRCEQLGIKFSTKGHIPLQQYINKLKPHYPSLSEEWNRIKVLRNNLAHLDAHKFMGPINRFYAFQHLINNLNRLFITEDFAQIQNKHTQEIAEKSESFYNGVFVLECDNKRFLINGAKPYKMIVNGDKSYSYWIFSPVLREFSKSFNEYNINNPICKYLLNVEILDGCIKGIDLKNQQVVTLSITNNPQDIQNANKFIKDYSNADSSVQEQYEYDTKDFITKNYIQFEYEYLWLT